MRRLVAAFCLSCLCVTIVPERAGASWEQLKQDGRVALVRHADAPGSGDPPGWRIGDCTTQRNLSERGRAQARALGEEFRAKAIPVGKVVSSQWCRTIETARLMNLGDVEEVSAFNNAYVLRDQRASLRQEARDFIASWRGPGVLVVVTHGENIALLTGISPASGEIVVVQAAAELPDRLPVIVRIAPGSS
jgi:phosphohistidine phosphatase SixA